MARILVIKLGALGDVIMATSLIDQIIRHHDNDSIQLLTTPAYADLFRNWSRLQVEARSRSGILSFVAMLGWIRRQRFDRVYDLQSNDRTGLLCALSGIKDRVGNHPRYPYTHHPPNAYQGLCHIHERMLQVLTAGGINATAGLPVLPADANTRQQIRHWLQENELPGQSFVLMHAGASRKHPEKCWPGFAGLATKLAAAGLQVIWLGTEEDAGINRQLAAAVGIDATGLFSVAGLAELGRYAAFAVTNDSGPMHILSAAGIPVYALFGPTNWQRNHALGQKQHVITADSGRDFSPADIKTISVDRVISKLQADRRLP